MLIMAWNRVYNLDLQSIFYLVLCIRLIVGYIVGTNHHFTKFTAPKMKMCTLINVYRVSGCDGVDEWSCWPSIQSGIYDYLHCTLIKKLIEAIMILK